MHHHRRTKFLSRREKAEGFEAYKRYSLWNGMGISFLSINIVSLLAINFDATNLELGYISSAFHLAGLILIFLPRLAHGFVVGRLFFLSWLFRGLVCILYGGLLFLEGRNGVVLILAVFTIFALFRMFGSSSSFPAASAPMQLMCIPADTM